MEPFIGQVMLFGFNFAPYGWAICDGSLMQISEYDTLFSLIGTTYGGDGITTFGLPDLRGRVPIHMGQGPGMTARTLGEMGGAEQVTLTTGQMPAHGHVILAAGALNGPSGSPSANVTFGATSGAAAAPAIFAASGGQATAMLAPSITTTGGNRPHDNIMPTLVANYCIALDGIYPSFG